MGAGNDANDNNYTQCKTKTTKSGAGSLQLLAQAELVMHLSCDCGFRVRVAKTHSQGTHTQDTTLSERAREGGLHIGGPAPARGLGARTYPVIHQKVILERKEALDSGQGFYGEKAQGGESRGKDRLNFSSMPAPWSSQWANGSFIS